MANYFSKELRDPMKATSDYLTSSYGRFSCGYMIEEEHNALTGKIATNYSAESPFTMLTQQIQQFGKILGIHAAAVGQMKRMATSKEICKARKEMVHL